MLELAENASKYCVGMEGNISSCINDVVVIKSSGARLDGLSVDDLVAFDFSGVQLSNFNRKGSMELSFHMFLLGFSGIDFVSHTHPTNTLKILCSSLSNEFSKKRLFPDQVIFNGKESCLVPYAKPGLELTEKIKDCVTTFMDVNECLPKLILLENHGIISCGKSVGECTITNDICEKSAEIFIGLNKPNNCTYLTNSQINELVLDKNEKYRKNLLI